jgi:hypothetical protein
VPVERAMMTSAQWDGVFVADPAADGARLSKSEVMGIGRPAPADQARLRRHEAEVRTIPIAARFAQLKCTFVDMPGHGIVDPTGRPELADKIL